MESQGPPLAHEGINPKYLPFEVNHFDPDISYEEAFYVEAERVQNLANYVTTCVRLCGDEDAKFERENTGGGVKSTIVSRPQIRTQICKLYDIWLEHMIEYCEPLQEVKDYEMEDELDPITFKARRFKHSSGMQVFTELTRLFYLKERPILLSEFDFPEEMLRLSMMKDTSWVKIVQTFDISDQYEAKEDKDDEVESRLVEIKAMWDKPILEYTQAEVVIIILFLVQQLNEVKEECIDEFRSVFNMVWIRVAQFMIHLHPKEVLNEPNMYSKTEMKEKETELYTIHRNFYMFVAIYMTPILRRFFYHKLFYNIRYKNENTPAPYGEFTPELIKNWVEKMIHGFAEEAFVDLYVDHCAEAYKFPGDELWYKYCYPNKIASVPAYLAQMRPHLYRRYFSESQASKKSVLAAVNDSYIARFFVLKAISTYIQIKTGITEIKFYDACAIQSMELNISYYTMTSNRCPLIVQAFSTYWAYNEKTFFPTNNVYETIGIWFNLLKSFYESKLHGFTMKRFIKEILPSAPPAGPIIEEEEEEEKEQMGSMFVNATETTSSFLV